MAVGFSLLMGFPSGSVNRNYLCWPHRWPSGPEAEVKRDSKELESKLPADDVCIRLRVLWFAASGRRPGRPVRAQGQAPRNARAARGSDGAAPLEALERCQRRARGRRVTRPESR